MRAFLAIPLFALLALGPVRAQDISVDPEPLPEAERPDPSTAEYEKCLALLRRRRFRSAQRAFRKFLKKYPDSPHAADAADRSDDNCYFGTEVLWKSGPPRKRIDVAVMGDGFTNETSLQKKQEKWAEECIKVLWHSPCFDSYKNYFNVYFVRLCSLEEGVDPQLTPEQLKKIEEKNRTRSKSRQKKTNFSTALDAKAAGPQGQVMMDRRLVYKWLGIANRDVPGVGDDRYVIAFAQFGRLGMGGGGIANVGRPDKSVTTHEFGHAFSRLLDEYANNPMAPRRKIRAANAYSSPTEPKKTEVPWAHMLKKRVKGVGIHEGGATFKKGVWRPAASCAMNAAGATGFCPVCREQTIKVIYEYVSPIEDAWPNPAAAIRIDEGDEEMVLRVTPMRPKHKLKVAWYVTDFAVTKTERNRDDEPPLELPGVDPEGSAGGQDDIFPGAPKGGMGMAPAWAWGGWRVREDRSRYANPPAGKLFKTKVLKGKKKAPDQHVFALSKLGPGNWRITCEVVDATKWVVKDEKHLLKERVTWTVHVKPKPVAEPKK
ncbi:MAG: M64 family metallopeptidase [Planctomycetota bacterium]|jgi:hypothetical protein